jgi:polyisoprenoid-binding protein YceI
MTVRFRLDPGRSRFTVQAFATGLLAFVGHSPTFAVRDFTGEAGFDEDTFAGAWVRMTIKADSLTLLDTVRPADRAEIEGRMRREVLETAAYPEIRFEADAITVSPAGGNQFQAVVNGRLSLHGVTNPHQVTVQLFLYHDGIRGVGESSLRMSAYRIGPVTALGGAIKLKDELRVAFEILGWKED